MQIRNCGTRGSVLVIALAFSVVLGAILASYLALVQSQNSLTARSQSWNLSVAVAEAGVEEGLAQINCGVDPVANGWSLTNGVYLKTRALGDNSYTVCLSNPAMPVLYSTGFVSIPNSSMQATRRLRVVMTNLAIFSKAIAASGSITLNGGVQVDSFDSDDPHRSTNGHYDKDKRGDRGDIATDGDVHSGDDNGGWGPSIHGHVSTGPYGSQGFSAHTTIGSTNNTSGVQSGWVANDMNVTFVPMDHPFSGGAFTPAAGTWNSTNFTYVLGSGNYQLASLSLSGQSQVAVIGNAVLYVTGNLSISGQASIFIAPGANLKLYCEGDNTRITGNAFLNGTGYATNLCYYGLNGHNTLDVCGHSTFVGLVHAPCTDVNIHDGDGDFSGSLVVRSATVNGPFSFHYDEHLGKASPSSTFVVASWNEY